MLRLLSTISSRTKTLSLHEIVPVLVSVPHLDQLDVNSLCIHENTVLSSVEYERFDELIQQSSQLQQLDLHLEFNLAPASLEMFES